MRIHSIPGSRRGITLLEVAIGVVLLCVLVATMIPMLGSGSYRSGILVSASNLRQIAAGCVAYEADWNGQVFSMLTPAMGTYNGCYNYSSHACPPVLILGADDGGGLWGYWITGTHYPCGGWPNGSCSLWPVLMPMCMGGTTGGLAPSTYGSGTWLFANARPLRQYICDRFYDPVFYPPNDAIINGKLQAQAFNRTEEFPGQLADLGDTDWLCGYGLSPAAMWGPGVLRPPSQGGFQAPDSYPAAYQTPTASAAVYPNLKTRLVERHWCQQPPALTATGAPGGAPYSFNAGAGSAPGAIFFDGHVSFTPMSTYAAEDAQLQSQGADGLWSRDTPYGPGGVKIGPTIDGFSCSPHLLTTGGITGRDLTQVR